jgi:hypothetical protein
MPDHFRPQAPQWPSERSRRLAPLAASLEPVRRSTYRTPPERRRAALELAARIGDEKAAYIYSVGPSTLQHWRRHS